MRTALHASFIFYREHKGVFLLLTISLSLLFFSCLLLNAISRVNINELEIYGKENFSMYGLYYQPASKEDINALFASLSSLNLPIKDINIRGEVELISTDVFKDSAMSSDGLTSWSTTTKDTTDDAKRIASFPLIGFFNKPSSKIDILRGTDNPGKHAVLVDSFGMYDTLFPNFYSIDRDDAIYLANGDMYAIDGIVSVRSNLDYYGIIVYADTFFDMTNTTSSAQIVFSLPLSPVDEQRWIEEAGKHVEITGVTFPTDNISPIVSESRFNSVLFNVLVLVCLVFSMRLMAYLFLLRKQEFSILRILGASQKYVILQILVMISEVVGISISSGIMLYKFISMSHFVSTSLPSLSTDEIIGSIIFFTVSAILMGIIMFVFLSEVDATSAQEEV